LVADNLVMAQSTCAQTSAEGIVSDELITLAGIARLARVQRPVVSVWRSRSRDSEHPFPGPARSNSQRELFRAEDVVEWLTLTGRGNNADPAGELALHVEPFAGDGSNPDDALAALLALSALRGLPLHGMTADELLDETDRYDPHDEFLMSELVAADGDLAELSVRADALADAAYGAGPALDAVPAGGTARLISTEMRLGSEAVRLVTETVEALNPTASLSGDVSLSATADDAGDLVVNAALRLRELAHVTVSVARGPRRRHLMRRLHAYGMSVVAAEAIEEPTLVAFLPGRRGERAAIVEQLGVVASRVAHGGAAVVLAPAFALTDALSGPADAARAQLLRSGAIRALVRLPAGLVSAAPRLVLAIAVITAPARLGTASDQVIVTGDLSAQRVDDAKLRAVATDLAVSASGVADIRAHSFAAGLRTRLLSKVVAARGSLVGDHTTIAHSTVARHPDAGTAVAWDRAVSALQQTRATYDVDSRLGVTAAARVEALPPAILALLVEEGHVRLIPGLRLRDDDVHSTDGYPVIDSAALESAQADGISVSNAATTSVDRLSFFAAYPGARLTEPGDVVFCTTPGRFAAIDGKGGSVVRYPARVLRINAADTAGLMPEVLVDDVRGGDGSDWHAWRARRVAPAHREPLARALAGIHSEHEALTARLRALDRARDALIDGVANGSLTVTSTKGQPDGSSAQQFADSNRPVTERKKEEGD
jgi:hypothetical protein